MYMERLYLQNIRTFAGGKALFFLHPDWDYSQPLAAKTSEQADTKLPKPRLPNVTLLLGDNGAGKSTVLRTIAATAFGPAAKDLLRDGSIVRYGMETGLIDASFRLHEQDICFPRDEIRVANFSGDVRLYLEKKGERLLVSDDFPVVTPAARSSSMRSSSSSLESEYEPWELARLKMWSPVFESSNDAFFIVGYGATRRVEQLDRYDSGARTKARANRDQRVMSLFEDSYSLIPLASWLPRLEKENPERYKQVVNLIDKLLKPGHYTFTGKQDERGDYLFQRGEMLVPFQALSDGYRAFTGWVADLLFHVCFGCPKGKKLVDSSGIVLVDEVDLHLHPKWQMQVISVIAKALPRMQFIFTSHSPLVAGSLEWMNIITLKSSGKTNKTIAKRLKQSIHGLDADQILLTDFFGLKSTMAPAKRKQLEDITRRIREGEEGASLQLIRQMSTGTEEEA